MEVLDYKDFCAVIPAAGSGSRMGGKTKKQFTMLCGYPLIYYPISLFSELGVREIILVIPGEDMEQCRNIMEPYFPGMIRYVVGGACRGESVYAGLLEAQSKYCFIHDGARPFVDRQIVSECAKDVMRYGSAVAAVPVKDTIKIADGGGRVTSTPPRSSMYAAQTPQTFPVEVIKNAYKCLSEDGRIQEVTDDAQAIELLGLDVHLSRGSYRNIKITEPADLMLAEYMMS